MTIRPSSAPSTKGVSAPAPPGERLLRDASRAAFWNAVILPIVAVATLLFSLLSGVYDVALALAAALMRYSSLGIPRSLSKFLPEVSASSGSVALRQFLLQAVVVRLLLLGAFLLPLNLFADSVTRVLSLGPSGALYIALISGLVIARAVVQLTVATLNAFFAQFWSNLFALAKAVLDLLFVGAVLLLGYEMVGVLGALLASAGAVAVVSASYVAVTLDTLSRSDVAVADAADRRPGLQWFGGHARRFVGFSSFVYVNSFLGFFTRMGFVAPVLAYTKGTEDVAVFATAYHLAFTTMVLVTAGFRGLYQPLLARLRLRDDNAQLQRAFAVMTKAQLVALVPAGMGLIVMSGDYVPLLFGAEFRPSVPIAWILVACVYASTTLNVPRIVLVVDEQYRAVLWTRVASAVMAPVFVIAAWTSGLTVAAVVLGGTRVTTAILAYVMCRRAYGVRFPWAFAGKVGLVSFAMAVAIGSARLVWSTTPFEAVTLTVAGIVIFGVGLRLANVLGPDEVDILSRSRLPGRAWLVAFLAPRHAGVSESGA